MRRRVSSCLRYQCSASCVIRVLERQKGNSSHRGPGSAFCTAHHAPPVAFLPVGDLLAQLPTYDAIPPSLPDFPYPESHIRDKSALVLCCAHHLEARQLLYDYV